MGAASPPLATASRRDASTLELRDVAKRYPGAPRAAVEGLTLEVPAGEVCVLVGPSGCGKTTALRMVNRLIEPTSGTVLIDGDDVRGRDPARLRREIGYVIQQVGLMPHLTVEANVATVPRLLGWDRDRIGIRVRELLDLVDLPAGEYAGRYPAELSGGQQQRVGLARALAADPPLMLMDEPFSAVDPITRERLQNDFLRLHRAIPKTVVFVSHDIDEAVKMADRIAVMREGRLVQYAPPAELLAQPADEFVASFVGADRALKSLSLTRVEDLDLPVPPAVRAGEPVADVRRRLAAGELVAVDDAVLIVAADGRPLEWTRLAALPDGGTVPSPPPGGALPLIDRVATLRDALSSILETGVVMGTVVDPGGRAVGLLSASLIADALQARRAVA